MVYHEGVVIRCGQAMDRTEELRALVKATRLRLRAQKQANGGLTDSLFSKCPERKPSPFAVNAKNAVSAKDFIIVLLVLYYRLTTLLN